MLATLALASCGGESPEAAAWPYSEVAKPAGKARGTVLYLHGGNWKVGRELVVQTRPKLRVFTRAGWRAVSVDYSAERPLGDAIRWYKRLTRRPGPLCVAGESAGAQLALMVAVMRNPDCVVAEGAPVDLTGRTPLHPSVEDGARGTFGDRLRKVSPLYRARRIQAPVLLGHYRDDKVVPLVQARKMKRAARARLRVLDGPGPGRFVHAFEGVERPDLRSYSQLVRRHLASQTRGH